MLKEIFKGAHFLLHGARLIFSRELRHFIVIPLVINILLFAAFIAFIAVYFSHYINDFTQSYPAWLMTLLGWLFWLIFWMAGFLLTTFLFTVLTNIIGSPFYGLLAEKTERIFCNPITLSHTSISFWKVFMRTLSREALKLLYFLPWLLLCLGLFLFPLTFPVAPFLWWIVLSWIAAIQYVDYAADNQHISLKTAIQHFKKSPLVVFGFGAAVTLCMTIPGANLIVPPAAVVGGTLLWHSLCTKHQNELH